MALEIERKFLVINDEYKSMARAKYNIRQGYLTRRPEGIVRIRVKDDHAYLTVKGKNSGETRLEFEYEIPYADGEQMLALCEGPNLHKTRYIVDYKGFTWEVDQFHGDKVGLVIAEVELHDISEKPAHPGFIGTEVTGDPRYYNSNL
ncbi:MAG: CYTH domain-containing protein [Muribaculaceae bacterium]|nr:CYTH domain-containing protein [Muribaculaceae bacterium]